MLSNSHDRAYFDACFDAQGEALAHGKDAWPKIALYATEAAACGQYTADDADAIFTRVVKSAALASVHDRSENGLKANISKLRQFLHMGARFGTDTIENAARLYSTLHSQGAELKSAYPAYVDVARAQLKADALLDDADIERAMLKGDAKPSTAETKIKQALKAIESAQKLREAEGERELYELSEAATMLARALTIVEDDRKIREYEANRPVRRVA